MSASGDHELSPEQCVTLLHFLDTCRNTDIHTVSIIMTYCTHIHLNLLACKKWLHVYTEPVGEQQILENNLYTIIYSLKTPKSLYLHICGYPHNPVQLSIQNILWFPPLQHCLNQSCCYHCRVMSLLRDKIGRIMRYILKKTCKPKYFPVPDKRSAFLLWWFFGFLLPLSLTALGIIVFSILLFCLPLLDYNWHLNTVH